MEDYEVVRKLGAGAQGTTYQECRRLPLPRPFSTGRWQENIANNEMFSTSLTLL